MNDLPEYVPNHPLIGKRVRCKDDGFEGTIVSVLYSKELAWYSFQVAQGGFERGGLVIDVLEFVDETP